MYMGIPMRDFDSIVSPAKLLTPEIVQMVSSIPRNRSEQEIAGYREVLSTIHEGYEYINPRPNIILQLHRDLYSYSQGSAGGSYKNSDNVIAETDAEGHQKTRFIPVPAFQTAEAMEELCTRFLEASESF